MDPWDVQLLLAVLALEGVQLLLFWAFVRHRYRLPLRQLGQLTEHLAAGKRPKAYYITGSPALEKTSRHLEDVGARLEELQRRHQDEEFNLNVLLANMVEGVMVVDTRHVIRLVNDELLALFQLKETPLQRTVLEALRESRIELIVRETLLKGEARRQEVILESASRGETILQCEVSAVPIRNEKGEVDGAVVVFHDITRLKQLEVMRQEFVANVSHELRTPLSIFRGYLETLIDHPDLPPADVARVLEAMKRNSNRLNSLVEDLLVLTRLESHHPQPDYTLVRLDAFFRQLVQDWEKRREVEPVFLEWRASSDLPSLEVDALRFEQVMFNLLENAVAYSTAPREVRMSAELDGGQIELRVTDNGIGIPPGDLPRIFERFYRVDKGRSRISGGTGLGLSISKQIIQSHNGTIHAESETGKGTTIVIRLPLKQNDPPPPAYLARSSQVPV